MSRKNHIILNNDSARNIAVNCLLAFERDRIRIQDALDSIFRRCEIDSRERRLAQELALGACRRLITLDHLISCHSKRPLRRIEPVVLQILRVGLYQFIYLERTPVFAAVHQAVQQVRAAGIRGADSFVNAVLRSVQRDIDGPVAIDGPVTSDGPIRLRATLWLDEKNGCQFKTDFLPDASKNPVKHIGLALSYPPWLVTRWLKRFDEETVRSIFMAGNSRPALTLRANRLRGTATDLLEQLNEQGIAARQSGSAIQLQQSAAPRQLPGYEDGLFSVQDYTAMSVAPLLGPQPGERVLDLCAAPGGKTTHLAELMDNRGSIVACDISGEKLVRIEDNCRRLGITIVETCLADDLDNLIERDGGFDCVLVDTPCSNTGVLARRVEVRHWLKPADLRELARKQMELLKKAVRAARDNAKILYSTCSIDMLENESLIQDFLQENPSFHLIEEKLTLPRSFGLTCNTDQKSDEDIDYYDGGYVALLVEQ
jgi:16S rRNA (cytosine967-C5)-methyltransferase